MKPREKPIFRDLARLAESCVAMQARPAGVTRQKLAIIRGARRYFERTLIRRPGREDFATYLEKSAQPWRTRCVLWEVYNLRRAMWPGAVNPLDGLHYSRKVKQSGFGATAQRLRWVRETLLGLSQNALGRKLGYNAATIGEWESGRMRVKPEAVALLAKLKPQPGVDADAYKAALEELQALAVKDGEAAQLAGEEGAGGVLRGIRRAFLGMRQDDLGRECGVSQNTVSQWENALVPIHAGAVEWLRMLKPLPGITPEQYTEALRVLSEEMARERVRRGGGRAAGEGGEVTA